MSERGPIDARQHMWWHRLRRLRRWGFVLLGGAVVAPLITCLLFGGVVIWFRRSFSTFVDGSTLIWLITAPVYSAAFYWTFSHMEHRYAATLSSRCPRCGYSLAGTSEKARCPECGEPAGGADRGLNPR